jgi:two-component system copper resistance phosphate regulon response regulator CusR
MHVLVVEDERSLAQFLRKGLEENGHAVDVAYDGEEGEELARGSDYDAVILDIMLPGQDGFEVVRKLRAEGVQAPVLFLSARFELGDRIRALDLGGDDYLVKPFAFEEVLARLRALQRRSESAGPAELKCADLVMDAERRTVTRAGRRIELTPKEFALLQYLLKRQGKVVTRTSMVEGVWDMQFGSFGNVVNVFMSRLRSKIDQPFGRPLIHTVRGVGYVLEARED